MKSFSAKIYKELVQDIENQKYCPGQYAMRLINYSNGASVAFSVCSKTYKRGIYFSVNESVSAKKFPKWKGVDIETVVLSEYGGGYFIALSQLLSGESDVFEIVAEDLRVSVEQTAQKSDVSNAILAGLLKWKRFFDADKDILMSSEKQQGLYGELLFLEESLPYMGTSIVSAWAGSDKETHDFYIGKDAVEVKTTATQAPYYAHISSEYQLDERDVSGKIFLKFYALRVSKSAGITLPELIAKIEDAIKGQPDKLILFGDKLMNYGYLKEMNENYTHGYHVRDTYLFSVDDGFPRVTKISLPEGVVDLEYRVSTSQCMAYLVKKDSPYS